jgi:hypothetical protein
MSLFKLCSQTHTQQHSLLDRKPTLHKWDGSKERNEDQQQHSGLLKQNHGFGFGWKVRDGDGLSFTCASVAHSAELSGDDF